jgi:hypothetical protein
MNEKAKRLLDEIAELLSRRLEDHMDEIEKITSYLEVNPAEYKILMIDEVVNDPEIHIGTQFAFPPMQNHSPEELKEKALRLLEKKLRRDRRLYLTAQPLLE